MSKETKPKEVIKYVTVDADNVESVFKFKDYQQWFEALQEAPSASLIKSRDLGKGKISRYVPLGIQEALADMFFRECDITDETIEIFTHKVQDYNSKQLKDNHQAIIKIRMSILPNYPNAEHRIITGIGSKILSGAKNSLEPGAPSTQSAAKSNALTNFGNIFGRHLNREFADGFTFNKKEVKDENSN